MALDLQTNQAIVAEVKKRYNASYAAKASIVQKWIELDKFDRGEQWQGNIPPWIPKPVTNYIHLVKTSQRANLALANPKAMIEPLHPKDTDAVDELRKALEFEWDRLKARLVVRSCIETALLLGTAIAHVYWDDSYIGGKFVDQDHPDNALYQGRICLKEIDPANFWPDPSAYRLEDCQWVIVTQVVPLRQIKANPKFREFAEQNGINLNALRPETVEMQSAGEVYLRPWTVANAEPDEKDGLAVLYIQYERNYDENGNKRLDVTYVVGDTVIYRQEDVQPAEFPFAVLYDYPQRKSFWGLSTAQLILEDQKVLNKVQQVIAIYGTLLSNPQKVVSKGSGIIPKEVTLYGTLPGKVWVTNEDAQKSIHILNPPPIPAELFKLREDIIRDIREIAGLTEAYMGQSVGSLTTSTGVNSLIERSTIRDRDKMIEIDAFVERLTHLILQFIIHYWEEPRWIRVVGDDGKPDFVQFVGANYRDLEYMIICNVSETAPTTRAARQQQADKLLTIQGQYQFNPPVITPEEYIKMSDINPIDKNAIMQRIAQDRMLLELQQYQQQLMAALAAQQQQQATPEGAPEITPQINEQAPQPPMDAQAAENMNFGR